MEQTRLDLNLDDDEGKETLHENELFPLPAPSGARRRTWVTMASIAALVASAAIGAGASWLLKGTGAQLGGQVGNANANSSGSATVAVGNLTSLTEQSAPETLSVTVDVHGDVKHPGLYTLTMGARVADAVKAAGGYRHQTDANLVNGAAPLNDGDEVIIAAALPESTGNAQTPATAPLGNRAVDSQTGSMQAADNSASADGVAAAPTNVVGASSHIDLNTASVASLETLPEIGPGRAAAIVNYREAHGSFGSITDLLNVRGIGPVIFSRISPFLYVTSP